MSDARKVGSQTAGFRLGRASLVCRWRLANQTLPLENRHLRALSARTLFGRQVPYQLVAWTKQHLEPTLQRDAAQKPDGVLLLIVDERGQAALTVSAYEPLSRRTARALAIRAREASAEAERTGVAPETLWLVRNEQLVWGAGDDMSPSASASLMQDLARAVGFSLVRAEDLASGVLDGVERYDELFLVSDEHGVVSASNASGRRSERIAAEYAKLITASPR